MEEVRQHVQVGADGGEDRIREEDKRAGGLPTGEGAGMHGSQGRAHERWPGRLVTLLKGIMITAPSKPETTTTPLLLLLLLWYRLYLPLIVLGLVPRHP